MLRIVLRSVAVSFFVICIGVWVAGYAVGLRHDPFGHAWIGLVVAGAVTCLLVFFLTTRKIMGNSPAYLLYGNAPVADATVASVKRTGAIVNGCPQVVVTVQFKTPDGRTRKGRFRGFFDLLNLGAFTPGHCISVRYLPDTEDVLPVNDANPDESRQTDPPPSATAADDPAGNPGAAAWTTKIHTPPTDVQGFVRSVLRGYGIYPADDAGPEARSETPPPQDVATQLERLAALHAQGLLDDHEFAAAKARLLY